ncbi:penicillin-insensitive murein endopeptidase, partial [bacterium]|nr:penicillin-insensitive murein endopeptidase [bacterium]
MANRDRFRHHGALVRPVGARPIRRACTAFFAALVLALAAPASATTPDRLFQPAGTWALVARAATLLADTWRVDLDDPWLDFLHPATAVGEAKDGRLLYPVAMTPSPGIYLRNPDESWTTSEVIVALRAAAKRVRDELPGGFDLVLGDFSLRKGGRFRPHSTHQNGLDVDLRYYQTGIEPGDYSYHFVTEANFDTPRVWLL